MNKLLSLFAALVVVSWLTVRIATAQDAPPESPVTLHIGDPAPPLAPASFIKGEPVKDFEKGKSYVVEFWATWCGPCRASIPHLTELQKQYKDITFIGQDVWEQDASLAKPFVDQMGDQMNYRVAVDDAFDGENGRMANTWMKAAGESTIPCAFLIDGEGKIAYIGNPLALDAVLKQYVAGKLDYKSEAQTHAILTALNKQLHAALTLGNTELAISTLNQLSKAEPRTAMQFDVMRYSLLVKKKDFPAALALARTLAESSKDNAEAQSAIAWLMVTPEAGFQNPDLDLALQCAQRGDTLSNHNPDNVDTLAHVYAAKGDLPQAIKLVTDALPKADDKTKPMLQKSLDDFNAQKKQ